MNIRNQVFPKSALWSGAGGRDYLKAGDEIFSINGLYCGPDGKADRWGSHVIVMDIRWVVIGVNPYTGKLSYQGDARDLQALDHWGYTWPEMGLEGSERVPWGDNRFEVRPPAQEVK